MVVRRSLVGVVVTLTALALALGCIRLPAPVELSVSKLLFVRATPLVSLAELFPGTEGPRHVFEVHGLPGTPGDLLVVGSHGGAWITDLDPVPAGSGRAPGVFVYLYPVDGAGEVRLLDGETGRVTSTWPPTCY